LKKGLWGLAAVYRLTPFQLNLTGVGCRGFYAVFGIIPFVFMQGRRRRED